MPDHLDSGEDLSIYKTIFQTSLDAMLLTNPDGSILVANHTAEEMFGMNQDEIIAAGRDGLLIQDESLQSAIKERAEKGRVKTELIFKRKDGSLFKGEVTSTLFRDENRTLKSNIIIRDISGCQKAEESLQESERKWRTLFEALPVGVSVLDKDRNVIYDNPALGKILGLSKNDLMAKKFVNRKYIYSDGKELSFDEIPSNKAFNEKKLVQEEIGVIKEDNSIIWTMVSAAPLSFSDWSVLIVTSDITARKNIEEDLKRHAALLDVSYEAIFSWNFEEGILSWNQGAETLYGYNKKESIGFNGHDLLKTEFPLEFNEFLEKLKKDKIWSGELIHTRKDGKKIIVESRLQLIEENSGKTIVIETNHDITGRKKSEIKLKETLENLEDMVEERTRELLLANDYNRNLIETSLDPLVTIGPDGTITDVNLATEKVTGYMREELVGTDFAYYFTNPQDAKEGYQHVFKEGTVKDYPLEIKNKDGNLTPVLYNASVYKDEFGEVIGVFAAARDITERKKAEKNLKKYWESLEEQVKQRTEELAKSNADLKQFAYVASHDLREPLRMITTFLQLLERRYKSQLDDDAREFIDFAVDGAKRLDKMIIDLLEYSRIANKEMMFSEVDFEEVMDQVNLNLNVIIYENNAEITHDYLPKNVMADENQMIILFQNLIGNAIKYRSNEKPKIHISAQKERNFFIFKVKDNGIGMDSKYLERIFTIFQRLHTHNEYEGSGIGLSIAQRIVHQHGGEIWVESEPGKGSTFFFTIKI
ncbi:PAS domain S-box protein [Methanobacterium sp.]|uniref:PAS domain S-box protein n=1 Tax=Methanobacterium sp. TaxID=2164 RepID=UPI002ABA7E9B|nr:PAS domain S-box protein [Methanobacterium sp.]MDY9923171.1 PAS domain S-box protein [Methanobacterium sp.]